MPANSLAVEHVGPVQPPVQLQVLGLMQMPLFAHEGEHTVVTNVGMDDVRVVVRHRPMMLYTTTIQLMTHFFKHHRNAEQPWLNPESIKQVPIPQPRF
jgi:hypothetical protein